MTHPKPGDRDPVIALYTPFLQGLYIGELVNQFRQLSAIKGYKLVIIRTGSFGQFNEPFMCDGIDGAIILRNAISPALAETFLKRQIACVSIAYDYFPLKLPLIISDHAQGMALAFEHLLSRKTDRIVFVGDMSHYDVRKRYESYCELHDRHNLPIQEENLINVSDALLSGGKSAAKTYIERRLQPSAVIFGSGLTGIGFIQDLKTLIDTPRVSPEFVCFDALPLIPVFTPEMASIDQNLHLIAYRAFTVLDDQLKGEVPALVTSVPPKLIRVSDNPADCYDAFMATCVDLPEFHNPYYMKSLVGSLYEWPGQALGSQLNQLMSIAPLFKKFMGIASLSRCYADSASQSWIKLTNVFSVHDIVKYDLADRAGLCLASKFPPSQLQDIFEAHDTSVHLPVRVLDKFWGVLSFFGTSSSHTPASSYFGFAGYVENLVGMYEKELEIKALKKRLADPVSPVAGHVPFEPDPEATVEWNIESNLTTWNANALAKLGYTSNVENEIFRNMEITDRIHHDDYETVRAAISDCISTRSVVQFHARFRGKRNQYFDVIMQGQPTLEKESRVKSIVFNVGVTDMVQ